MTPIYDPEPESQGAPFARRGAVLLLGAILVVAAILRFHAIGSQSFWTDEVAGILMADRPWPQVIGVTALLDVNPPLGYLAIHFWEKLGRGEAWMRTLPALLGLLGVVLIHRLGTRLFGRRVGLFAALFLATSPLAVYFSQEVRYYNLGLVLALADLLALVALLDDPHDRRAGRWFVVLWWLSWLTHYYFFFLFIAGAGYFVATRKDPGERRRLLRLSGVTALLYSPWFAAIVFQFARKSFQFRPHVDVLDAIYQVYAYFTLGHSDRLLPGLVAALDRLPREGIAFHAGFLATTLPFLIALAGNAVSDPADRRRSERIGLVVTFLLAPLAIVLAVSRVLPLFRHLYFILLLPAFLLLCARGIERLRARAGWPALVLAAALVAAQGASLHAYFADPRFHREDWRGLVATIREDLRPGDAVVTYSRNAAGALYFYGEPGLPITEALANRTFAFAQETKTAIDARLEDLRRRHRRVWFVRHYAHMFDPAGHVAAFFAERMLLAEDLSHRYRIDAGLYYGDRADALADGAARTVADLRFGSPFHPLQAGPGFEVPPTPAQWVWMGPRAEAWLPAPPGDAALTIEALVPVAHLAPPVTLAVAVDGRPVAARTLEDGNPRTIAIDLPPIAGPRPRFVRVTLTADRSFRPTPDSPEKALLVRRVALLPR